MFVKADLSKELPEKITYNIQGEETTVYFKYPWLPPKCTKCGRWGHYETFCKENKKEMEVIKKAMVTLVKEKENVVDEMEEGEIVPVECSETEGNINVNKKGGEMGIEGGKQDGWKTVSMEKAGRSPKTQELKYGQVTISTPSRYAALSN